MEVGEDEPKKPETMACPFCNERISKNAKKCRFCGETVDVALRAAEEARNEARRSSRRRDRDSGNNQQVVINQHSERHERIVVSHSFPHGLHLLLTVLTCGLWLPIWLTIFFFWSLTHS
jgi:hypothetical protein